MTMRKVALRELSKEIQSFLAQVKPGNGLMVEDENGRARYGIIPYTEASAAERAAARKRLERLQKKVGKMMEREGKNEQELDRILQEDG